MTARPTRLPAYYTIVLLLCAAVFISYIDRTNISVGAIAMRAQFGWSETQKGLVLSSFYVGYLALMLASGALANRFGGKVVLGIGVAWWSLATVLTPASAFLGLPLLVAARIALGLGEATVFPSAMNMIGRSVPRLQRSRAVSLVVGSIYAGTVFAMPVSGWLVQHYGWTLPFYIFGGVGFIWVWVWFAAADGRATEESSPAVTAAQPVPWRRLFALPAVWAIVGAHFCANWTLYLMSAWLPSYFARAFGVSVLNAGLLSAAPSLAAFAMSNVGGYLADRMLRAGCSASFVRKLLNSVGAGGAAFFLLALPSAGSVEMGLVLTCCAMGMGGLAIAGFVANMLDIAPRHADVLFSISNTVATLPGIFGIYLTGWLVERTGHFAVPFYVAAGLLLMGVLFFARFSSGEQQIE